MEAEEGLLAGPLSSGRAGVRHRGALHDDRDRARDDDGGDAFRKHPSEETIWATCFDD